MSLGTVSPERDTSGFSLMETLVLLAVMGLAVLIASNSFLFRGSRTTQSVSSAIIAELQKKSIRAITSAKPIDVHFSAEEGVIRASDFEPIMTLPTGYDIRVTGVGDWTSDPRTVVFTFFADGTNTGGQVYIQGPDQAAYTISINWLTGEISVEPAR